MNPQNTEVGIRYRLLLVETLILAIPLLILSLILFQEGDKFTYYHLLLLSMIISLVLAGLIIVRQIFDMITAIATSLKASNSETLRKIDMNHDIAELRSISGTFNNLVHKLEQTTEDLRKRHSQLLTLQDILEITKAEKDIDKIMGVLLEKSMGMTGSQTGSVLSVEQTGIPHRNLVFINDEKGSSLDQGALYKLRVVAAKGQREEIEKDSVIDLKNYVAKDAIIEGKPLLVENIEQDDRTRKENNPHYDTPSFLSLPIFVENKLFAVVNLSNKRGGKIFDDEDRQLLTIMLGEISFAIENAVMHSSIDSQLQKIKKHNLELEKEIEARNRTERALRDSEKKYRELLQFLPISVFEIDTKGLVSATNETGLETFGYTREDIEKGLNVTKMFPKAEFDRIVKDFASIIREGKTANTQSTMIKKNGSTLPVLIYMTPIRLVNTIAGYRGAIIDFTERMLAEQALSESEAKYKLLADKMTDIVWIQDMNLRTLYVSPSVEKLLGFTPEERVKQDVSEQLTPASLAVAFDRLSEELALEEHNPGNPDRTITIEMEYYHKDGSTRWLENIISGIRNDQGVLTGLHGVSRDITARKQARMKYEETRNQLMQAEKLAAVGRLTAGITHEILNPLNIISMEIEILQAMEDLSAEVQEELSICMTQINRIVSIAESLKQVSRVSENILTIEDINEVIAAVLKLYATPFSIETIKTTIRYDSHLPKIVMDRGKIEQLMMNLISNAVHAMEGKLKKELTITTDRITTPEVSDQLRIGVADTGTGIKDEDLLKIFDPFFTTKEQGKGMGLGLSISYAIVSDHGGKIWAENNAWGGATLFVNLPIVINMGNNS